MQCSEWKATHTRKNKKRRVRESVGNIARDRAFSKSLYFRKDWPFVKLSPRSARIGASMKRISGGRSYSQRLSWFSPGGLRRRAAAGSLSHYLTYYLLSKVKFLLRKFTLSYNNLHHVH